jgi:hypothetical protein
VPLRFSRRKTPRARSFGSRPTTYSLIRVVASQRIAACYVGVMALPGHRTAVRTRSRF